MQQFNIDENILNRSFSDYESEYFIKIDQEEMHDYEISYHYNYYYPSGTPFNFSFMKHRVSKAGFAVAKDKSIEQVVLYLKIFDIDMFYKDLVKRYGKPETTSISKFYLEKHGYKIPSETDGFNENSYDSLPTPLLKDFKNLRNVTWYEVNDSVNKIETNLIVRNKPSNIILGTQTHEVEITFRR
ncbi:hypothetical protein BFP77_00950 [Maribacter sp. 4U21]|uniref:hypothetical protein n=1 Tax=Maribacter sp. 4U21 TaxID=1889779 RepID=UPI000C14E67E|nr:hypothetical protein [Maribacter sp. 4U21]PIB25417.1 hypothetical protein BFP77_00950 [Maribacter sp. 4U21]